MKRFEAVLFDMDGVIVDSEESHVKAEQQTCIDHNFDINPEDWDGYKGRTAVDIFRHLIDTYGDPKIHDIEKLMEYKTDVFLQIAEAELKQIEGAVEFLHWSREFFKDMALVTSSNRRTQQFIVEKLGINSLFDTVVTGSDIKNGKPHPEPYQRAMRAMGSSAHRSLVVEDSMSGIQSGHAAGCEVMAVATSHTAEELEQESPLHIFEDYSQARAYLFNWYGYS